MTTNKFGFHPKSIEELVTYIKEQENQPHDYNSVAEALANVTVAAFNYFASSQGMTGFQASWAGLKALGMQRGMEGPFAVVDGTRFLYPQYDPFGDLQKWHEDWKPALGKMAKGILAERGDGMHWEVRERMEQYSQYAPADEQE